MPMTFIDLQGYISYFCLKTSVAYFSVSNRKSRRSSRLSNEDLEWPL